MLARDIDRSMENRCRRECECERGHRRGHGHEYGQANKDKDMDTLLQRGQVQQQLLPLAAIYASGKLSAK